MYLVSDSWTNQELSITLECLPNTSLKNFIDTVGEGLSVTIGG